MAELTVLYDKDLDGHGEAGICISNMVNGKTCIMKMELGEQANILYRLLTEQMKKAEIKKVKNLQMKHLIRYKPR